MKKVAVVAVCAVAIILLVATWAKRSAPLHYPSWHTDLDETITLAPHQWQIIGKGWPAEQAKVQLVISAEMPITSGFIASSSAPAVLSSGAPLDSLTRCGQWLNLGTESNCKPAAGSVLFVRDERHPDDGRQSNRVHVVVRVLRG